MAKYDVDVKKTIQGALRTASIDWRFTLFPRDKEHPETRIGDGLMDLLAQPPPYLLLLLLSRHDGADACKFA